MTRFIISVGLGLLVAKLEVAPLSLFPLIIINHPNRRGGKGELLVLCGIDMMGRGRKLSDRKLRLWSLI